jgi:hypothetical protein
MTTAAARRHGIEMNRRVSEEIEAQAGDMSVVVQPA